MKSKKTLTDTLPWQNIETVEQKIDDSTIINESCVQLAYLEGLENAIKDYHNLSDMLKENEDIVMAFSMFAYRHNDAYHYNLPFLPWRYNEFIEFLRKASLKYLRFIAWLRSFCNDESVIECFQSDYDNLSISMNTLWICKNGKDAKLLDKFDISKAFRDYDVCTVNYRDINSMRWNRQSIKVLEFNEDEINTGLIQLIKSNWQNKEME